MNREVPKIPRYVVTGHKNGVATIVHDALAEHVIKDEAGFVVSDVWATDRMPAQSCQG